MSAIRDQNGETREEYLERKLDEAKLNSDQLMLVIEGQDTNYERMVKDRAKLISYLLSCPRPPKPHHFEEKEWVQWEYDVEHYETYLESNPPADFK